MKVNWPILAQTATFSISSMNSWGKIYLTFCLVMINFPSDKHKFCLTCPTIFREHCQMPYSAASDLGQQSLPRCQKWDVRHIRVNYGILKIQLYIILDISNQSLWSYLPLSTWNNVVNTIAPLILARSSSNLQVTRTDVKSQMSLISSQVQLFASELRVQIFSHSLMMEKPLWTWLCLHFFIKPNKKICVFRVTGLKILGRVGTVFFFFFFLSTETKRINLSKCIKLHIFQKTWKQI